MLPKLFTFDYLLSLAFICCLITTCKQNSEYSKPAEPVIQLPKPGSPMSTPPTWSITPYDNLKDSVVTPEWDVSIVNAHIYQDLMPSDRLAPSVIFAALKIKNKQKHSGSFTWEALVYEGEARKEIPINLSVVNTKQEKNNFTVDAKSVKKLELQARQSTPLIRNRNDQLAFTLIMKLTDDKNRSIQLRASSLKISTAQ